MKKIILTIVAMLLVSNVSAETKIKGTHPISAGLWGITITTDKEVYVNCIIETDVLDADGDKIALAQGESYVYSPLTVLTVRNIPSQLEAIRRIKGNPDGSISDLKFKPVCDISH